MIMTRNELGMLLIGIVIGMYLLVGILSIAGSTYKQGQVDAINGKIYYHLDVHDDKSSNWEKIK